MKDSKEVIQGIMLLLTHNCNLNCTYCYENNKSNKVMQFQTAKEIISKTFKNLHPNTILHIHYMGGEPLLQFKLIKQITEWVISNKWRSKYRFFIPTNGTLLDSEMKEWFKRHRELVKLGLSCDGNKISQDTNRSNSYQLIDFDFFKDVYPDRMIKMTISPSSISEFYNGVIDLNQKGFMYIDAELAHGVEWKREDILEYKIQLNKLIEYYSSNPRIPRVSLFNINVPLILRNDLPPKKCGCGSNFRTYDTDGSEYYCQLFSPISLSEKMIEKSKKLDMNDYSLFTNDICSRCILRNVCIGCCGMNFRYTGKLGTIQPIFCHIFKEQFYAACRLQKNTIKYFDANYQTQFANSINKLNKCSLVKK